MVTQNVAQYRQHHVTDAGAKFEVAAFNGLGRDTFTRKYSILHFDLDLRGQCNFGKMHLQENTLFDLWPWPWAHGHIKCCQSPLHDVTYAATKFESAMPNGLGGDTFTRNVTDGQTDRRTDDGATFVRNQYTLFSKKKAGIMMTK